MSVLSRRQFLTLSFAVAFRPWVAQSKPSVLSQRYAADISMLYSVLKLRLEGEIAETIDRSGGKYYVTASGKGPGISNLLRSAGILQRGRWTPLRSDASFDIRGRLSQSEMAYDWDRREISYHARAETFFLRRVRTVDDIVTVPEDVHVDDVISATLNFADGRWPANGAGLHRTVVVRRRRTEDEGPDDIAPLYRAELVPLELRSISNSSKETTVLFDLSRFSSWATQSEPARMVFSSNRRPELIFAPMILGTSVTVRFSGAP
jgi:hypothetical protein